MEDATQRGFEGRADAYERGRPSYSRHAIDWAVDRLHLHEGADVADLGAGTGTMTAELADRRFRVHAVEPAREMLDRIPPRDLVRTYQGRSEETGLSAGSVDAVFSATAWHWFDGAAALDEVARILRPGGGLALLWNLYDETEPWVRQFAAISYRWRSPASPDARSGRWKEAFEGNQSWHPLRSVQFPNPQQLTPDGLIDRLESSSVFAGMSSADRALALAEARELLNRYGILAEKQVTLPYTTHVYVTVPPGQ